MGADLPGEGLPESVVVGYRGHGGGLGVQGDGRERHPFAVQPAHQFGRQVLGFGGGTAVAGGEQPLPPAGAGSASSSPQAAR